MKSQCSFFTPKDMVGLKVSVTMGREYNIDLVQKRFDMMLIGMKYVFTVVGYYFLAIQLVEH